MPKYLRNAVGLAVCSIIFPGSIAAESEHFLECTAAGYDILITNSGSSELPPGTGIRWHVRFARRTGDFVVEDALAPEANVFVSGALGSDYLSSPQPCTATIERQKLD